MNERSLAVRILALTLCVSLPTASLAGPMRTAEPAKSGPGAVVPAGVVQITPVQLQAALDLRLPLSADPKTALGNLKAAAASADVTERAAALALVSAVAPRKAGAAPQAAVDAVDALPAAAQQRLAAAAGAIQDAAQTDRAFAKALEKLRASAERGATEKAAARIPALLERAKSLFTSKDMIAVPGGPGGPMPGPLRPVALAPNTNGSGAAKNGARKPLLPSSKIVSELQVQLKSDRAAALARAEALLIGEEDADPRVEVRLAAIRALADSADDRPVHVLTKVVDGDVNWYTRREAARALGLNAKNITGASRDSAIKALQEAAQVRNDSLRLMAAWSLQRFGVDPKPYVEVGEAVAKKIFVSVPQVQQGPSGPQQPKKSWLKRLLFVGIAAWLGFLLYAGSQNPQHPGSAQAANGRAAVEMVQPKSAADSPVVKQAEAPKVEEPRSLEKSVDDLAKDVKRTADAVEKLQQQAEKQAKSQSAGSSIGGMVLNILMWIGIFGLISWLLGKMRGGAAGQIKGQLSQVKNKFERPDTQFTDVAGIDDAMAEMEEIVDYLHNPQKYARLGARVPKGVLMEGPPGTGKTLLARALAGESGAAFFSVSGSDFIEMFVGVGASRVRELFAQAKAHQPAIIFIDELDAVAKKRDGAKFSGGNDEREQTVNAILAEMSGFDPSSGVIVIAATNRADVLDPAITRPGRFDRKIHVGLPDVLGREAILGVHARKARLSPEADLQFIAKRTAGLSGAFLENIVNEAALLAARRGADEISQDDLNQAVDRNTVGTKRNLFIQPELKKRIAYHESGHVIAGMIAGGKRPNRVTVIPHGGQALGWAEPGGDEDRFLYTQQELEARLVGILGGLTAEKLIYDGKASTGPGNDLEQATRIARMMVEQLGMSDAVGYGQSHSPDTGMRVVSEQTAREIDLEVKRILGEAQKKADDILREKRPQLEQMVHELLERETLTGEDIERILLPSGR